MGISEEKVIEPEPTESQCWEHLGKWGQTERELLFHLQKARDEYQGWLEKLNKILTAAKASA